ncbi:transposase zinc-binding domain-containing protein, partial [Klebsiella pneumoniae]|uniref:transposase zinc-binding domain-containing protein n=3 Tax=Enterobacterales TaxID=91347 RepID=UPI00397068B9
MPRLTAPRRQAEVCAPLPAAHAAARYARHLPERTLLYALVQAHYPDFIARLEAEDRPLPEYVREEFETYLRCGVLEHGFLRVVCEHCRAERLVAYSCKKRGLCPSCGARRMAESARHLVDEVFGPRPVRQWVLSFPYPLRFLFASKPEAIGPVLGIVHRVIAGWLADQAGVPRDTAQCGVLGIFRPKTTKWGSRDFPSKNDKVLWRPRRPWPPEGYYFSLTGKYPSIERISSS